MYEMKCRVRFSEIENDGYISKTGIIDLLQNCSTFHSEDTGFGMKKLMDCHHGWFVTDWQVKVLRRPAMAEYLTVRTYPYNFRSMIANRYFTISDANGEVIIKANSIWVYMDLENNKPDRAPKEMMEAYGQDPAPDEDFGTRKIRPSVEPQSVGENGILVDRSYLDTNNHVNNGRYIDIAERYLPQDREYNFFKVEYKSQALENDIIYVRTSEDNGTFWVSLTDADGEVYCITEWHS